MTSPDTHPTLPATDGGRDARPFPAARATGPGAPDAPVRLRPPQHRIERTAIVWWMLRALVRWGTVVAVLVVASVLWEGARPWLVAPIAVAGAILLARLLVEPWWRYAVHRWELTDQATYAVTGWVVREWRVAPTSRIQTVDAVRGPLEQLLGLATLRVTTASSSGAINIVGLDKDLAQQAAARLAAVAELTPGDAT